MIKCIYNGLSAQCKKEAKAFYYCSSKWTGNYIASYCKTCLDEKGLLGFNSSKFSMKEITEEQYLNYQVLK